MVVNHHAITEVTQADKGRPVSYQCSGMVDAVHGSISGLSYIEDMVFVKFKEKVKLVDMYNCRWGHVKGWIE